MDKPRWISMGCLALVSSAAACDTKQQEAGVEPLPQDAKQDNSNQVADRECTVVLREAGLLLGGAPVRTVGYEGRSHFALGAAVDVADSAIAAGAEVGLAGRPVVAMESVDGAPEGYSRFMIEFVGPPAGQSLTSLTRAEFEIAPFVDLGGVRHFDHNRMTGDAESYRLVRENSWKVGHDALVCPSVEVEIGYEEVLSCDGGAAVIDADTAERRNLQLVVRDPEIVASLAGAASTSYGVAHFAPDGGELIIRGRTQEGVFERGGFSWMDADASFEALELWAPESAPAARVYMEGDDLHVVILNHAGTAGQPRCDSNEGISNCVVADWVFGGCS